MDFIGGKDDGGGALLHWSPIYIQLSYKMGKAPIKSSPPTNQHPAIYSSDALPVTQPTVSKHNYNDGKPNSCDICSARITTIKKILSACKSVDV